MAFVAPLLKDASKHENELAKVVSAKLLEKAKAGMSVAEDNEYEGVRRVTFGVVGSQLRQKDLAPRSTGAMACSSRLCRNGATTLRRGTTRFY